MQITVAMAASRKERANTAAYPAMPAKFSRVGTQAPPASSLVKAYTTTTMRGITTNRAIHST